MEGTVPRVVQTPLNKYLGDFPLPVGHRTSPSTASEGNVRVVRHESGTGRLAYYEGSGFLRGPGPTLLETLCVLLLPEPGSTDRPSWVSRSRRTRPTVTSSVEYTPEDTGLRLGVAVGVCGRILPTGPVRGPRPGQVTGDREPVGVEVEGSAYRTPECRRVGVLPPRNESSVTTREVGRRSGLGSWVSGL